MIDDLTIDGMVGRLMTREGGFVDHPNDAGGATNHGITMATLAAFRGAPVSAGDVRALTRPEAAEVYTAMWVDHPRMRLREWPYGLSGVCVTLAEITLDAAVMFSLGRQLAVSWLQEALNRHEREPEFYQPIVVDGWAGPATRRALERAGPEAIGAIIGARCRKHARVVAANPSQAVFVEGWINRATEWIR